MENHLLVLSSNYFVPIRTLGIVIFSWKTKLVTPQPTNALEPILVTLFGKSIDFKTVQYTNALAPISFKFFDF